MTHVKPMVSPYFSHSLFRAGEPFSSLRAAQHVGSARWSDAAGGKAIWMPWIHGKYRASEADIFSGFNRF